MKILVAGQAKSGTTALYHALKQSLPHGYKYVFEPRNYVPAGKDRFVLAKALINADVKLDGFKGFDRKILLVRDPRDNLVSRLLYAIYDKKFLAEYDKVRIFTDLLERKRQNPPSISLVELWNVLSELAGGDELREVVERHQCGLDFDRLHKNYLVYKYEYLVAGRFSRLEKYLGITIAFSGNVDPGDGRVARTKGSGDWTNWFTEQDVEFFSPVYRQYMAKYGYEPEWALDPNPIILPEYSTEYVMRLIAERRSVSAVAKR